MSLDRTKLGRVLALLASDQPGERDAAVLAAGRLLKAAGLRWEGLVPAEAQTGPSAAQIAELTHSREFWRQRAAAAEHASDMHRTSSQTWGKRCVAFERRAADLQARLDIAQAENAKLRKALGPEAAARAVFESLPAVSAIKEAAEAPPRICIPKSAEALIRGATGAKDAAERLAAAGFSFDAGTDAWVRR